MKIQVFFIYFFLLWTAQLEAILITFTNKTGEDIHVNTTGGKHWPKIKNGRSLALNWGLNTHRIQVANAGFTKVGFLNHTIGGSVKECAIFPPGKNQKTVFKAIVQAESPKYGYSAEWSR